MRVLLIAEAANPEWTSVPLVGWSLAHALMQRDDIDGHLVTQVRNRQAIERFGWTEGRQFTAIDSESLTRPLYRLGNLLRGGSGKGWTMMTALSAISYQYFERLVWKRFGRRIQNGEFDLVHRLTPLSPTAPSPIAGKVRRAGVRFVWGPINGGLPWPREFDGARRAEREWLSYVRGAYKLMPGYHATRRNCSTIIIGSKATWDQMPARYHPKCHYIPENAIDPMRFTARRVRQASQPIRAVFLGRLVPYKGPDMLLEAALPLLKQGQMTLDMIGDGPLMSVLRGVVEREGLEKAVRFRGWVEHQQVQHELAEMDVLTFPSIREFGGAVVLEAMAVGVVPVIVDYGGPAELVTTETGWTIPMGSRAQIVENLRGKLAELCNDPARIDAKSQAAREHVFSQFTWQAKAGQVLDVYRGLLQQDAEHPQRTGADSCPASGKGMAV
jgi:glycosyltransferase involved in cell wall biosynthesis